MKMLSSASLRTAAPLFCHVLLVGLVIKTHVELSEHLAAGNPRHRELTDDVSTSLVTAVDLGELKATLKQQSDALTSLKVDTEARLSQQANATITLQKNTLELQKKLEDSLFQTHEPDESSWTEGGNATVNRTMAAILSDIQELKTGRHSLNSRIANLETKQNEGNDPERGPPAPRAGRSRRQTQQGAAGECDASGMCTARIIKRAVVAAAGG